MQYSDLINNEDNYKHFIKSIKHFRVQYRYYAITAIDKDNIAELIHKLFDDEEYLCVDVLAKSKKIPTFLFKELDIDILIKLVLLSEERDTVALSKILGDSLLEKESETIRIIKGVIDNILIGKESSCMIYSLNGGTKVSKYIEKKTRFFQISDIENYLEAHHKELVDSKEAMEILKKFRIRDSSVYHIGQRYMDCSEVEIIYNSIARYENMSNTNSPKLKTLRKASAKIGVIGANSNTSIAAINLVLARFNNERK